MFALSIIATASAIKEVHVDARAPATNQRADGTPNHPYRSLQDAKEALIRCSIERNGRSATSTEATHRIVVVHPGVYKPFSIDHPALSRVSWEGVKGSPPPVISGGIRVPQELFKHHPESGGFVASLASLGADDLGAMMSGDCVTDCQHDKVGVSFGGEAMTLARWPNAPTNITSPAAWANAATCDGSGFTMDLTQHPEAERMLKWSKEKNAFVHGFWAWDWADCYGKITEVRQEAGKPNSISLRYSDVPDCKAGARWMGVNMLCELDAPGEYFIDADDAMLYLIPPTGKSLDASPVMLMYQRGGVVNITSAVQHARISHMDVRDGRHTGVLAASGVLGLQLDGVIVHAHGTNGIDLTNSPNGTVMNSQVFDVGCTGLRATAGDSASLSNGNVRVLNNSVHHFAKWKRSYQPGIFWAGVGNTYSGNTVSFGPHNGFLGGGDFGDGVNNVFEGNHISDCTFDTIDSGGFYTCGQRGSAFTNRGNVLRGNHFARIHNTAGLGVQMASNQAVYLDDQMSDWLVVNNTFVDCEIALFNGGGRRNKFQYNTCTRCGTLFYLNNQGMPGEFDHGTVNCSDVQPPFQTQCSTGAAEWMLMQAPAAAEWAKAWPEMLSAKYIGYPAYTDLSDNTYCCAQDAEICEMLSSNTNIAQAEKWHVAFRDNEKGEAC